MKKETKQDIIGLGLGYLGAFLLLVMMWISPASAMYAGDNITFETNLTNPVYVVTGNSSNLDGLHVSYSNNIITITPEINYKPDNFTMIFFDNITNEVIKVINRGGGSRTRYVDKIINETIYVPEYIDKVVNKTEIEWIDNTIYEQVDNSGPNRAMFAGSIILFVALIYVAVHLARRLGKEEEDE